MKGLRIHKPKPLAIPQIEKVVLSNGLKVYFIEGGAQQVVKFEWCFKAGRSSESNRLGSGICHSLIKEGCEGYSGYQIAEHFDYYGSSLNHQAGFDYCSYSFYCLNRYFHPLLDMFLIIQRYLLIILSFYNVMRAFISLYNIITSLIKSFCALTLYVELDRITSNF